MDCSLPGSSIHGIFQAKYWSGLPFPSPGDLPDPGIEPAATAAKSLQSCPTLCDPIDGSPPGSTAPGILQARTLEWVAISFSNTWMWKVKVKSLSRVWLFPTPGTAAYQAPPSMGYSRQEYWSGVPLPSLGIEPGLMHCRQTLYCLSHQRSHEDMRSRDKPSQQRPYKTTQTPANIPTVLITHPRSAKSYPQWQNHSGELQTPRLNKCLLF